MILEQQKWIDALRAKVDAVVANAANQSNNTASAGKASARGPAQVRSGNDELRLAISVHVNRTVLVADDGGEANTFHVDNDTEPTVINFAGTVQATTDLTIAARVEAQFDQRHD